jgi:bifunctional non-homologous end joining protein LigD
VGYSVEMKWDGARAIAVVAEGELRLFSRNQRPITHSYPELADLPALLRGRDIVLDGEIVALQQSGQPRFGLLQERLHVQTPPASLVVRVPVIFYAFDVLALDGAATIASPYLLRRELLAGLELASEHVQVPPHWDDVDGEAMLAVARQHDLEGIVSKKATSPYRPGVRSRDWIKTPIRNSIAVVIGGWVPGGGRRSDMIGALLVGAYDDTGRLGYLGHVGTGFTEAALRRLRALLTPLERPTSPFAAPVPHDHAHGAHWVQPLLTGEVEYRELTGGEHRLRHPAWKGLRNTPPATARIPPVE